MFHAIWLLAAEEASKPSKAPFYVAGLALAGWAVLLSVGGLRSPNLPESEGASRLIILITAVLVVGAMVTAVVTA
jgi:hypothetical protein